MLPWSEAQKPLTHHPQWNPLQWDAIAQFYPWRVFYARSMSQGVIPLWNPHQFCGTPFLANGQSAVLYPPNLMFLIFDPITAFTAYAWLHLVLAASFTYLLMRRVGCEILGGMVSGIVYAFSAFFVLWLELPTFIGAAIWLPLVLLLIDVAVTQRSVFYGMISGAVLALAFLAGHFQIALYVALAAGLWWMWKLGQIWCSERNVYVIRKAAIPLLGFVLAVILISAAQVLPSLELAMNSHRVRESNPMGYTAFIANALKPYRLITAFVPNFFGNPANGDYFLLGMMNGHAASAADYMEYGLYAGILPLLLSFVALAQVLRRPFVGYYALLSGLSMLIALGTPLNIVFYYGIPGFSAMGGPNRILMLYLFAISCLAGFGADHIACGLSGREKDRLKRRRLIVVAIAISITVMLVIVAYLASQQVSTHAARWWSSGGVDFISSVGWWPFAGILPVSIIVLLAGASRILNRSLGFCLVTVIVLDLFAFGINYNPTCERSQVYPSTTLTTRLKKLTENGGRIVPINPDWNLWYTPKAILPPNAAMVYGLYDFQGYDSLYTKAYKDWSSQIQGVDSSPPENGNMVLMKRVCASFRSNYLLVRSVGNSANGSKSKILDARYLFSADGVDVYRCSPGCCERSGKKKIDRAIEESVGFGCWYGPNRVGLVRVGDRLSAGNVGITSYPGWVVRTRDRKSSRIGLSSRMNDMSVIGDGVNVVLTFEPFSFRLGLFMMCIGVGLMAGFGSYRVKRLRGGLFDG